jgi:hypothetical protein
MNPIAVARQGQSVVMEIRMNRSIKAACSR